LLEHDFSFVKTSKITASISKTIARDKGGEGGRAKFCQNTTNKNFVPSFISVSTLKILGKYN